MPQGARIAALLGVSFVLYGKVGKENIGPIKPFIVKLSYEDGISRRYERERSIDIKQFAGLPGFFGKSHYLRMAESLEKIDKQLSTISRQAGRFSAFVDITEIKDHYVKKAKGDEGDRE